MNPVSIGIGALALFVTSCTESGPSHDVYLTFPQGTALSTQALAQAEQICPQGRELITTYTLAPPLDDHKYPHLLFWNRNLRLSSAHYFPSQHIERIEAGTIHGLLLNTKRAPRSDAFRHELASGYRLELTPHENSGYWRMDNALVDQMTLSDDGKSVTLALREGSDKYGYPPDTAAPGPGVATKTRTVSLCELHFARREQLIRIRNVLRTAFEWNELRVPRPEILDTFYRALLRRLEACRANEAGVTCP
ncbi:MAG: hypothetical protein QM778_05000 [Myxococcales bacterium]